MTIGPLTTGINRGCIGNHFLRKVQTISMDTVVIGAWSVQCLWFLPTKSETPKTGLAENAVPFIFTHTPNWEKVNRLRQSAHFALLG